jgi:hypothetical protein
VTLDTTFTPTRFNAFARGFQLAGLLRHLAQHVGVHAAAQTLVGRDDDEADGFRLDVLGLRHERVGVLRVRSGEVGRDVTDLLAVGTGGAHPVLRLAHLGRGDHFHRLGDLLRIFYAFDLASYLFACCHEPLLLKWTGIAPRPEIHQ